MADAQLIRSNLMIAQQSINEAINIVIRWQKATVQGVPHTPTQRLALISAFDVAIANVEAGIALAKSERNT
jgi:hypothetical protein